MLWELLFPLKCLLSFVYINFRVWIIDATPDVSGDDQVAIHPCSSSTLHKAAAVVKVWTEECSAEWREVASQQLSTRGITVSPIRWSGAKKICGDSGHLQMNGCQQSVLLPNKICSRKVVRRSTGKTEEDFWRRQHFSVYLHQELDSVMPF